MRLAELCAFVALNALLVVFGRLLLARLRLAGRPSVSHLGLSYVAGYAATALAASWLFLLRVPAGWIVAAVGVATVALALAGRGGRPEATEPRLGPTAETYVIGGLLLAVAIPAFAVRPLVDWDSWALWGLKARALLELDGVAPAVFASHAFPHPDYPLLIPSGEALQLWALGGVSPWSAGPLHLQFLLLGVAFAAGSAHLFGVGGLPRKLAWRGAMLMFTAPVFGLELLKAQADAPLAIFVALAAISLVHWVGTDSTRLLPFAGLMLAAAASTKNEGAMLVLVLVVALLAARGRRALLPAAALGLAAAASLAPWRVYGLIHDVRPTSINGRVLDLQFALENQDRLAGAAGGVLLRFLLPTWPVAVALLGLALVLAARAGAWPVVRFSAAAVLLSVGGLVAVYYAAAYDLAWYIGTSATRVTLPIGLTIAALAPLVYWQVAAARETGEAAIGASASSGRDLPAASPGGGRTSTGRRGTGTSAPV